MRPIDIEALRDCMVRGKYTVVPRTDYFNLLVKHSATAFTDNMIYEAYEEFNSKRGDKIKVRKLYLKKLLEAEDEYEEEY